MSSMKTRRVISTAAAIAIASTGLGATLAPAMAQTNDPAPVVTSDPSPAKTDKGPLAATFPADGKSTLTLHKKINPADTKPANPRGDKEPGDTPGKSAGEGFTFTLKKVADGNQLKNQKVFNALAGLSQTQSRNISARINADETLKAAKISAPAQDAKADFTLKTDAQGVATQANIPNGVYLVTETESPDGVTSQVHPFLVFLPQPDPSVEPKAVAAEGDWNNDVHVYPKNGKTDIDKKVVDANKNVGDTVDYTLTATVPSSAQGETLTKFNVRDMFTKTELGEFKLGEATITHLDGKTEKVTVTQGNATALTPASSLGSDTYIDYTVPTDKLKGGDVVTIKVSAKMLDTRKDSEIINQARTIVRHSGDNADKESTPVEVRTYVGDVELTKFNDKDKDGKQGDGEEVLEGATFEIFRDKAAADKRAANPDGPKDPAAVGTATTGKDGKAKFTGLHVTDFENNADVAEGKLTYYLVEVKAPDGFVLPDAANNVHPITLTREDNTAEAGKPVILVNSQSVIPNVPDDRVMPQLPVTGENGIILMGGAAFILLAGAGVFAATRNRKES